jgi:hypothetical protein
MRSWTPTLGLVCGLVLMAQGALAVTHQSYAKVSIVQGADVIRVPQAQDAHLDQTLLPTETIEVMTASAPDGRLQFALAGPSDSQVSIQIGALGAQAEWDDPVESSGAQVSSRYDAEGYLLVEFGLEDLTEEFWPSEDDQVKNSIQQSSPLVLSVTYE